MDTNTLDDDPFVVRTAQTPATAPAPMTLESQAPAPATPLAHVPQHQVQRTPQGTTPADLVALAISTGADLDRVERLMEMKLAWEREEARKAFDDDMARAKLSPPTIVKEKHVNYKVKSTGQVVDYWHASIGNVVEAVVAWLAEHGFSHRWVTDQNGNKIRVTCVIKHRLGHTESTTLEAHHDESGGKNSIQAMVSAKSYLERHTLTAATGLATKDQEDDDGRAAGIKGEVVAEVIAQDMLTKLLADLNKTDTDAAAAALWATGAKMLASTKSEQAFEYFKAQVVARRTLMRDGQVPA